MSTRSFKAPSPGFRFVPAVTEDVLRAVAVKVRRSERSEERAGRHEKPKRIVGLPGISLVPLPILTLSAQNMTGGLLNAS